MNLDGWEEIYGTAICLARRQDTELTDSDVKKKLTIKFPQECVDFNFNSNNQPRILSLLGVYILYTKSEVTLSQKRHILISYSINFVFIIILLYSKAHLLIVISTRLICC